MNTYLGNLEDGIRWSDQLTPVPPIELTPVDTYRFPGCPRVLALQPSLYRLDRYMLEKRQQELVQPQPRIMSTDETTTSTHHLVLLCTPQAGSKVVFDLIAYSMLDTLG
jgi:hypothetical protein